jgi:hypothetical protein
MLSRYEPKMMGLAVALSTDDDNTHFGEVEPLDPLDNSVSFQHSPKQKIQN